jgi:hypothetical protein
MQQIQIDIKNDYTFCRQVYEAFKPCSDPLRRNSRHFVFLQKMEKTFWHKS